MRRSDTVSARVLFSLKPTQVLFLALLTGSVWGCVASSRLSTAALRYALPLSIAGRSLLRTAIVSFLFPVTAYLCAICFGTLPVAILFFCKGTLVSCLLYQAFAQGAAAQIMLMLLFHSLLPLPLQLSVISSQLCREPNVPKGKSSLSMLLFSSILVFAAELCLSRLGI